MKAKKIDFMDERIGKLLKRMNFKSGKKMLVFLDTGAIIDAETEFARWRCHDSRALVDKIYNSLLDKGLQLFVTAPIFGEVSKHHNHHRVGGRAEISKRNFEIVTGLHKSYETFLQDIRHNERDRDAVRRDVYWASIGAFEEDNKKRTRDPISYVDRDLISSAALAKYAHVPFYSQKTNDKVEAIVQKPDEVILLSPDSHVEKTINVMLTNQLGFNYDGIRTVSSR